MAFKDNMIIEAEKAINSAVSRRKILEDELDQVAKSEEEARMVLQLLKTGRVVSSKTRSLNSHDDYMTAIETIQQDKYEFDHHDLAGLLDVSRAAASQKVKTLIEDGTLVITRKRGPGNETRKVRLASLDRD
jgi:ribosomal protein L19E